MVPPGVTEGSKELETCEFFAFCIDRTNPVGCSILPQRLLCLLASQALIEVNNQILFSLKYRNFVYENGNEAFYFR